MADFNVDSILNKLSDQIDRLTEWSQPKAQNLPAIPVQDDKINAVNELKFQLAKESYRIQILLRTLESRDREIADLKRQMETGTQTSD